MSLRLLLVCLFCACLSSPTRVSTQITMLGQARSTSVQIDTTVIVAMTCLKRAPILKHDDWLQLWGSGVIIDDTHILTAHHVVDCPLMAFIEIRLADGRKFTATTTKIDTTQDVAILSVMNLKGFELNIPTARIGREPEIGELLCFYSAHPFKRRSCGKFDQKTSFTSVSNAIEFAAEVTKGNSGSGVYNQYGELVGVVTNEGNCGSDKHSCTYAAALQTLLLK